MVSLAHAATQYLFDFVDDPVVVITLLESGAHPHNRDGGRQLPFDISYNNIYKRVYHASIGRQYDPNWDTSGKDIFLSPLIGHFNTYKNFKRITYERGKKLMELFDKYFPPKPSALNCCCGKIQFKRSK